MLRVFRSEQRQKPPPGTPLDGGHPLRPHLAAYLPFLHYAPADLVSRSTAAAVGSGSPSWIAGPRGGLAPLLPATLQWQLAGAGYAGGPFAVAGWVYRAASDAFASWAATGNYAAGGGWVIASGVGAGTHTGAVLSNASAFSSAYSSANFGVGVGEWHHYAMVFDGASTLSYYFDGAAAGASTGTITPSASTLGLWLNGTQGQTGIRNIAVDNVAVFNAALAAAQVADLYRRPWQLLAGRPAYRQTSYVLMAGAGAYALSGNPAALAAARRLDAAPGDYALSGGPASLLATRFLDAAPGVYGLSGGAATWATPGAPYVGPSPDPIFATWATSAAPDPDHADWTSYKG